MPQDCGWKYNQNSDPVTKSLKDAVRTMSTPSPYQNPYKQPRSRNRPIQGNYPEPSGVLLLFRIYCGFMVLFSLALIGIAAMFVVAYLSNPQVQNDPDGFIVIVIALIYGGSGIVLGIIYGIGIFFCKGKKGWVYGIVLIVIGMTSCVSWPFSIPLIIFWLKPENKRGITQQPN